ncbi:MAG: hypothetical protein ACO2YV_09585, partial [Pseudomonadales bacterium]
ALLEEQAFATDVAHGCTRSQQRRPWGVRIPGLAGVDLVDTPGIDEIAAKARQRLAASFSSVPFPLLRQRFNLGRRFILMAMAQWLRRHGHFRGKAAKAFLADLPRLLEALLRAPTETA